MHFFKEWTQLSANLVSQLGLLLALLLSVATDLTASTAVITKSGEKAVVEPALLAKLALTMAETYDDTDKFEAEVWLRASEQRLRRYVKDHDHRVEILQLTYREANARDLDPDLVLAVMQIESAFNKYAISRVGAQGIMQVMPFWRVEIGRPHDILTDAETNIRYGTTILAHYIERADGDLVDALGRYNGSRGRLKYPEKVIGAWRKRWRNKSADELPAYVRSCEKYPLRACRYN